MTIWGGRYRAEERLDGGVGQLWSATDEVLGRKALLRVLPRVDRALFEHELRLAVRARHLRVARIFHAGLEDDGTAWIASEHRDGVRLDAHLAAHAPLDVSAAGPLLLDLADALAALHDVGLVHDALCPSCAVIDDDGARLVDLGVGAPSDPDLLPPDVLACKAPEAFDAPATTASDVYGLGVLFHQLLTGRPPLPYTPPVGAFRHKLSGVGAHPLSAILPGPWRNLLAEMLSFEVSNRPPASDVVQRLRALFPRSRPVRLVSIEEPVDDLVLEQPVDEAPRRARPAPSRFVRVFDRPLAREVRPEHLVPTSWPHAPYVVIEGARITALTHEGREAWTADVEGSFAGGLVADLDKDDVGELYLVGPERVACLDAHGATRFTRPNPREHEEPGPASAVVHGLGGPMPVLVVDGRYVDHEGRGLGGLARVSEGDGAALQPARVPYGLALDGFAGRGYRGAEHTAAAVLVGYSDLPRFVAHLEIADDLVNLCVWEPDGPLVNRLRIATRSGAAVDPSWAPIAAARPARRGRPAGYTVIVPWLDPVEPALTAFDAESGDLLWRLDDLGPAGPTPSRAILGDLDGDGAAELVLAHGSALRLLDPHSGANKAEHPFAGVPVAIGDPAGIRYLHLLLRTEQGMTLLRGPRCEAGTLQWHGARGDLWRSGTVGPRGLPIGPR